MKSKYIKPTLVILGVEIRTIEINGIAYVSARGTTDVFNLNLAKQKSQLEDKDNIILYGVIDISTPEFADYRDHKVTITGKNRGENTNFASQASRKKGQHADREDHIFIRMDRAMMFIARVSTARMRVNGNEEGADAILAKQLEYAQALHDYETLGIAINRNHFGADEMRRKQRLTVAKLIQIKSATADAADRHVLASLIGEAAGEIGATYQPDLIDGN